MHHKLGTTRRPPNTPDGEKWSDRRNRIQLTTSLPPRQRNLNNAFAYDLVPSPQVVAAALKAARRVNDFATAIRIFEGMTRPPVPECCLPSAAI